MKITFKQFISIIILIIICTCTALPVQAIDYEVLNPFDLSVDETGAENVFPLLIGRGVQLLLSVVGAFALFMFIYGGFTLLTSAGIKERILKGKESLIWSTIGLFVILLSYVIISFLIEQLT